MIPPIVSLSGEEGALAQPATADASPGYRNPLLWAPSSYFAMGLIYVTVGSVANIMFKNMGMQNDKAAFWSSIVGFPYMFKFVWAPLLELYKTKKFFVVLMQFAIAASVAGIAFALKLPGSTWFVPVFVLVGLTAVLGATQDMGSDGVYVTTLPPRDQAKYLGFQSMCSTSFKDRQDPPLPRAGDRLGLRVALDCGRERLVTQRRGDDVSGGAVLEGEGRMQSPQILKGHFCAA